MPKLNINYKNTINYRIVCKDVNITECYVGHTTHFTKRKQQHKSVCNNPSSQRYHLYVYEFIRENGDWDNWDMIEIEKYEAVDSNDSHKRERHWIEFYKASLNKQIPSRTDQEYYEDNKDQLLEYQRKYNKDHKEEILEKGKQYYEDNKEQIAERHRQYRKDNKEDIAEYHNKYYEGNKDRIKERTHEQITCICGCIVIMRGLERHQKSKKHLNAMGHINNL